MSTSDSCKDTSKSNNNDGVCDVKIKLQNMSTADNSISVCANCGNEGNDVNNICNKCKKATYCNAACKKKHRHKHKNDCEEHVRLAAEKHNEELRIAAELHDEELFKQPPPLYEDCPICFERMPIIPTGSTYKSCCGKEICSGCIHAPLYDDQGNEVDNTKCPFCRIPMPYTDEEANNRLKKRMKAGDAQAMYNLGYYYSEGIYGYPQDYNKALELYYRAADLGYAEAYCNIGYAYSNGEGVKVDMEKANHYYELAAMGGNERARHNLGVTEGHAGNFDRALKHFMIAVRDGFSQSLKNIKILFKNGHATKDDYMKALQSYQIYLKEIKSVQRDKAAAAVEKNRYY